MLHRGLFEPTQRLCYAQCSAQQGSFGAGYSACCLVLGYT